MYVLYIIVNIIKCIYVYKRFVYTPGVVWRVRMRAWSGGSLLAWALLAIVAVVAAASYDRERFEIAKQILSEVPLIDG